MSVTDHVQSTHGRARLSFASVADIDEFVATLEQYERGEMTPDQWRAFRLVRGTYGQRQADDAQMLRVKIPQGMLTSRPARTRWPRSASGTRGGSATSPRGRTSSSTSSSCTTSSRRCACSPTPGVTTREACGNSVRNITACPYAGVSADERVRRDAVRRSA